MGDLVTVPDQTDNPNIVSVVIPAYNAARWIEETLASVAAQTYGRDRIEVVVVDDGSTDDSAAIAERVLSTAAFNRWAVIRQENRGPSAARNVGWRWARGGWIRFLDADDLIDPEITSIQMDVARTQPDDVAIVYSEWQEMFTEGGQAKRYGCLRMPDLGPDAICGLLSLGNVITTGSYLVRPRHISRVGGWSEDYVHCEDFNFLTRIALADGMCTRVNAGRAMFTYRRHGPSLSSDSSMSNSNGMLRATRYVEEVLRERGKLTSIRSATLADRYGCVIRSLAQSDWNEAVGWLKHLEAIYPNYIPIWSSKLRVLSRIVGFRRAVRIAVGARCLQYKLNRIASSLVR